MPIMTLDEAINKNVAQYSIMYVSSSYDAMKFRFLDQTLNVLGNGIDGDRDFLSYFQKRPNDVIPKLPSKYYDGSGLFRAYTELDTNLSEIFEKPYPLHASRIDGFYTEEELKTMEYAAVTPHATHSDICPYPNFQKQYSLYYQLSDEFLSELDKSWLQGMLWFYTRCQQYFNSDECQNYHRGAPADDDVAAWTKLIEQYEAGFERIVGDSDSTEERNTIITKHYDMDYTGDTKAFINSLWQRERDITNAFLVEVIADINKRIKKNTK